jgi:hypothetical protein
VNTATRISSSARALLAALVTTLLVVSGLSLGALPARAATGDVTSATLDWGIKQSFRSYIKSPIAKGTWTIAGNVTDTTPFAFTGGAGTASQPASTGSVGYTGSIHFQGHEGTGVPAGSYALDLTISDVRVKRTSATAAQIVVDVYSNSLAAPTAFVQSDDVVFATVDLAAAAAASTPTAVAFSAAPAVLTAEGATAFAGFYPAGTALDPVSFNWPVEQAPVVQPAVATSTALAAPAAATVGTSVPLSATVSPAGAVGSVGFFDGATSLATVPVASGTASTSATFSAPGAHSITAVFTPADPSAFVASTSAAATVTVSAAPVADGPKIVVSKSVVSAAGETVTVTGSGFSPVGTATNAARPPLAGKFGGVYVTFGKFANTWKASEGAASSARAADRSTLKWVVNPADVATVGGAAAGAVPINADGTFSIDMLVKPGFTGEPATGNYGVYTYPGGGVSYPAFETYTPFTFAAAPTTPTTPTPEPTVPAPTTAGLDWGVKKSFRDYIVSPIAHGTITTTGVTDNGGVYTFPARTGGSYNAATGVGTALYTGSVHFTGHDGVLDVDFANPSIRVTSPTTGTLAVNVDGKDPVVIATLDLASATTTSTAGSTSFAGTPATLTAAGAAAFGGFYPAGTSLDPVSFTIDTSVPADPSAPVEPEVPVAVPEPPFVAPPSLAPIASPASLAAGSLTWGVKQSFRDYVTGPIAKGAVTTSGVASSGSSYTFGQAAGGNFDPASGLGSSNYSGSVRFTGHAGLLDVTLGNPVVRVDRAGSGTLLVSVNGGAPTPFATLDLAAGSRSTPGNAVSYSGVPASLTAQGAAVFSLNGSGFYAVGAALDPVSFVIGAPNVASNTVGATVASFKAPNTAAPTPPATTGIQVVQGTALKAGDEVTITAGGFRPNETGILVVIYSTPTVLDTNATADANGVVTWTGRLPAGLSGAHTLTLQGSVDRGVELTIAGAELAATVAGCVVDDATLTWGFKESFRAYISGSIANGEWTVADGATYAVPDFGFGPGSGGYDAASGEGQLAFAGSIAFTGHSGVLNTTVANPQIRFVDASSALLLLDISGTTQDGAVVDNKAVEFAELELAGVLENEGGAVTITAAPASLTEAGAAAFGTYPAGEALDPVTVAFTTAADCAAPVEEAAAAATTADAETVSAEKTVDYAWVGWLVAALVLIAAVVAVVVVLRRRRKA